MDNILRTASLFSSEIAKDMLLKSVNNSQYPVSTIASRNVFPS